MSKKSHVSMEAKLCAICGKQFDTDSVLLHKRFSEVLEQRTVTGWGRCHDCEKKLEGGDRIALVECESRKDWERSEMTPEQARRTGRIAFMKRNAFRAVFNVPDTKEGELLPMVFVEDGVIAHLEALQAQQPDDNTNPNA